MWTQVHASVSYPYLSHLIATPEAAFAEQLLDSDCQIRTEKLTWESGCYLQYRRNGEHTVLWKIFLDHFIITSIEGIARRKKCRRRRRAHSFVFFPHFKCNVYFYDIRVCVQKHSSLDWRCEEAMCYRSPLMSKILGVHNKVGSSLCSGVKYEFN